MISDVGEKLSVLIRRDFVNVNGPDAASYLQGQLSQEVLGLGVGSSTWSLLLNPNGKVVALVRLARIGPDAFVLESDEGTSDAVTERLKRFMLRTKVEIDGASQVVLAVRGDVTTRDFTGAAHVIAVGWPLDAGVDVVNPTQEQRATAHGGVAEYDALRISNGVPAHGNELTDKTIPDETGWVSRSVCFTKGCYTGQELVARIDSRGHVNKYLRLITGGGDVPELGADLLLPDHNASAISSSAPIDDGFVALAYVQRKVTVPATAELVDGRSVHVQAIPEPPVDAGL